MEKRCLECNDVLHGRSDKKFCSDACRNTYNNKKKSINPEDMGLTTNKFGFLIGLNIGFLI